MLNTGKTLPYYSYTKAGYKGIRDRNGKECPWVGFLLYPYPTLYSSGKKIRYPYPIHQFMIQMYIYLRLGLGRVWQYMYPIHCQSGKVTIQKKITLSCQVSIHQVQDKLPSLIRDLHFYIKQLLYPLLQDANYYTCEIPFRCLNHMFHNT